MHSVHLHPGGSKRGAKKERRKRKKQGKGEKKRERKGAPKKERREGKENMQKKRKSGKKSKVKKDIKRKPHGWRPVSDNMKRLKEKEPMKKETRQERVPRYLKF